MICGGHVDRNNKPSSSTEDTIDYRIMFQEKNNFRNINDLTNNSNNFIYDLH